MEPLRGVNMTNFFKRELLMYSLGDIRFSKPVSLKRVAYTFAFIVVWTAPIIWRFGFILSPYYALLTLGPPFLLGYLAVKPVFNGKTLIPFAKTMISFYFKEPKGWTDLKNNDETGGEVYFVEDEIWISRRRDIAKLEKLKEAKEKILQEKAAA